MSQIKPLVSIIIPTFNSAKFVEETLDSIYIQEDIALDVVLADDGSTDDTEDVIRRYQKPLTFIPAAKPARTPSVGRNVAMRQARGEYLPSLIPMTCFCLRSCKSQWIF